MPIYNPMLFTLLIKILRCTCQNCHRFKMNKYMIKRYEIQFRLILAGLGSENHS